MSDDNLENDSSDQVDVSVVMPNFNHGRYVARSLGAILSQRVERLEILIIDDASTDDSVAIIEELIRDHPNVRLVRNQTNMGVTKTVEKGIRETKGACIYFAAADDCAEPGFLADAVEKLGEYPGAGFYCGDMALHDGQTKRYIGLRPPVIPAAEPSYIGPDAYVRLLENGDNHLVTGAAVFRRDAIVEAGGFDAALGSFSDGYLARKIALKRGFVYSPRVNARWFIFPSGVSMSTAIDVDKARQSIETAEAKLRDPIFPPWYAAKYASHLRFAMSRAALNQPAMAANVALEVGLTNDADRRVMRNLLKIPNWRVSRLLSMTWLWFRLRPYRIRDIVWTYLVRRFRNYGSSKGV
jgi:glycosyltransferase involved in cell wall biosynthesis